MRARFLAGAASLVALVSTAPRAQTPANPRGSWPMPVDPVNATTGGVDEESLLLLQLVGRAPLVPISIRSFSQRELDTLASFVVPAADRQRTWRPFALARPVVSAFYNSSHAFYDGPGITWAGRGFTGAVSAGVVARYGPFSFALRPAAFWTQNLAFDPPLNASPTSFANAAYPGKIDLPYRFGPQSYARADVGESWLQLDTRWIVTGISTATQAWGPMHVYPLLLGPNAGGFPHVFGGTGLPWNVGIGKVSGRIAVGQLDRSAYAPPRPGDPRRLAAEAVAAFTPAGVDGLELGAGRFFHRAWTSDVFSFSTLRIPFEALLKNRLPKKDSQTAVEDNQLASVFFRLVRPRSGVEVYGEFLRDDHSFDLNDLVGEPDHESAYGLGLRRAWVSDSSGRLTALTLEMANGRISRLQRLRGEDPMYVHTQITEGHTVHGKLLASPAVFGGSGYHADLLRRNPAGGWRVTLASENIAQNVEGGTWNGTPVGYYLGEVSRIITTARAEYTVGASMQVAWNGLSGGNNLGLTFTVRPAAPR